MKGWLFGGTTVLLVLVCEGEEKFLYKGMKEMLKSRRKGGGSKTLGKFRKEAAVTRGA